jgi:hypothetical protein
MRREDKRSPLDQGQRDTEIRRETAVRGSMGKPASGADSPKVTPESDVFNDQPTREQMRGGTPREPQRPARQPGKLPLPD